MRNPLTIIGFCLLAVAVAAQGVESDKTKVVDERTLRETLLERKVPIPESEMSVYVSETSLQDFLLKFPRKAYLTFPEVRERSIRILDGIPEVWTRRNKKELTTFEGNARPGEYFTFQVGVHAARKTLKDLKVIFSNLKGNTLIEDSALICFNLEGVDHLGCSFKRTIDVAKGRVQPLWFGVPIPVDAQGLYRGKLTISSENAAETEIDLVLNVAGTALSHKGVDEARRLARLWWLNSTIAHDDEVTRGYIPVSRKGRTFDILGRRIALPRGKCAEIEKVRC